MKLKDKFIVHNMGDEILLVSADDSLNQGFIRGNSSTALIIEALAEDISEEAIVDKLFDEFDAPREVIAEDVHQVLTKLARIGAIESWNEFGGEKSTLEKQLVKNGRIMYHINGDSMLPLLKKGRDVAVIVAVKPGQRLRKYDVPLYKRNNGQYVLHRIIKVCKESYVTCGDNRYFAEKGVKDENIIGVLECVIRNGERVEASDAKYIEALEKHHSGRAVKGFIKEVKRRLGRK